jgi:hypothetical protein
VINYNTILVVSIVTVLMAAHNFGSGSCGNVEEEKTEVMGYRVLSERMEEPG